MLPIPKRARGANGRSRTQSSELTPQDSTVGTTVVEEHDSSSSSFRTSQTRIFPLRRSDSKNLSFTVVTSYHSLDLLRSFKGLAGETRRKLRFAGKILSCVQGQGNCRSALYNCALNAKVTAKSS